MKQIIYVVEFLDMKNIETGFIIDRLFSTLNKAEEYIRKQKEMHGPRYAFKISSEELY